MVESYEFLRAVLDTVSDHIVVIDNQGDILFVNESWNAFGQKNACLIDNAWQGVNYLQECDKAAAAGDDFGVQAATGIRAVISQTQDDFYFEYPCHSPDQQRWFMMRIKAFSMAKQHCYVISHQNISERKLAEQQVLKLSRIDGLTNIANRRYFNEFLDREWNRCRRLGMPLSLAMIDLDHFKLLNDAYGHQVGDQCLQAVARVLKQATQRTADLCARYGGEEFMLVYGDSSAEQAIAQVSKLHEAIGGLHIANKNSPTATTLTASIGLATLYPSEQSRVAELIKTVDQALYQAKENGRDQIYIGDTSNQFNNPNDG